MHNSNNKSSLVLSLAAAFGVSGLLAATASAQSPHVHGAAAMNMVVQGEQLMVEFDAPLASVVGFEYKPQSRVEKMKLKNAVSTLSSATLFEFAGAECEFVAAKVKTPWPEAMKSEQAKDHHHDEEHGHDHEEEHGHEHEEEHGHEHEEEHGHEHEEEHGHEHEEEHGHEHEEEHGHEHEEEHGYDHKEEHKHHEEHGHGEEHHDEEHDTHSDITATYEYKCDGAVKSVKLGFFSEFALMENIKVQWITDNGQGAETLTAAKTSFSF